MKVKLDKIQHNPYNTREDYGDLSGLQESISRLGLTQPFLVREIDGSYQLAFGSRRYEAMRQLGIEDVDVQVREMTAADMAMLSICENVHRKDMTAVELGRAYEKGVSATDLSVREFAKVIGVGYTTVIDYISILELPNRILNSQEKYGKMRLLALGKAQGLSRGVRTMVENVMNNKDISSTFLKHIVTSCERVYASSLPSRRKDSVCGDIIFHDYSDLAPENHRDILSFSQVLLAREVQRYQEGLRKTKKARKASRVGTLKKRRVRKIGDIVHVNVELDRLSAELKTAALGVSKAIKEGYYTGAAPRSQRKFRTAVNRLTSGIEEILKDEGSG